ncbi:7-cyano-7-deazaguanine synthase [Mesorhizobium sp. NZP2077]|uniref:7-cyano-7-deazaguanine synthase n=1 Tax=Mesorhizobium sp. NZP2077 TaxID=2483404 RepID=UPI0015533226|nr:7-cyano-7-deazaguanine synthase [Mesorhizobium sp. NZP2077]QKC82555.1 tRNA methyl transferase-like protein [Mesorhizobium sp. NZP2077]QKD16048.1 tRNA methyl transferase-like protein [Mesorhizobium sp. NZP2077]
MSGREHRSATVLLSGGLDSSACAYFLQTNGFEVSGLFIDHGQAAASREAAASAAIAARLSIQLMSHRVSNGGRLGAGELIGRNAMLIFNALFLTRGQEDIIAIGAHAGVTYFDCTERFIFQTRTLVEEITDGKVSVAAPFISWTKRDVFDFYLSSGLPIELTYSCETGSDPVCGICASCLDRKKLGC